MDAYAEEIDRIKQVLRANPRGMTILNLSKELNISRNSAAKYLDILLVSGQVEMESVGPAKIYFLSHRVPSSTLINYSSDHVMVLNDDFKVTQVNDGLLRLLGVEREDVIGKYIDDPLFHFSSNLYILSKIEGAMQGYGYKGDIDLPLGGKLSHFAIRIIPATLDSGMPGISIFMNDVTEEKEMEQRLNKYHKLLDELTKDLTVSSGPVSDEHTGIADVRGKDAGSYRRDVKNQAILDAMPDMIFSMGKDGTFIDYIASSDKNLLYPPRDFLGRKVKEIMPEELSGRIMLCIDRALESNEVQTIQYELPINGRNLDFEARIVASGEDEVIAIATDITERKQAEDDLRESQEKYSTVVEKSNDGIIVVQDSRIIFANSIISNILGYSKEKITGRSFFDFIDHDHRELVKTRYERRMKGDPAVPNRYEIDFLSGDNKIIPVEVNASYIEYAGRPADLIIIRDITERKIAENKLKQLNEQLKRKLEIEQVLSNITYMLISSMDMDITIMSALERLGKLCGASRTYIFLFRENGALMDNTYEWCSDGVESQKEKLQSLPADMFPWWMDNLHNGGFIHIKDVSELPMEASAEKGILEMQGIKSLIVLSLYANNELIGFIGLDNVLYTGNWDEKDINVLRTVSYVIGTGIERQQMQSSLQESEKRLAAAQHIAHIGNWDWDIINNDLYWSDEVYCIFGHSPQEFKGTYEAFLNLVHPDETDFVQDSVNKALYENKPYSIDHRIILPDGSQRFVHERAEVTFNEAGQPTRMIGTVQDITERKQAEKDLRESESNLKVIFENVNDGIVINSQDGRFLEVNQTTCDGLGYSKEELLRMNVADIIPLESRAALTEQIAEKLNVGGGIVETRCICKDGSLESIELNIRSIEYKGIPAILIVVRNITDIKRVEKELMIWKTRYEAAVSASGVILYGVDLKSNDVTYNDGIKKILGYDIEDMRGGTDRWMELVHPEDREYFESYTRYHIATKEPGTLKYRLLKKDGNYVLVEDKASFIKDSNGELVELVGFIRDITENR